MCCSYSFDYGLTRRNNDGVILIEQDIICNLRISIEEHKTAHMKSMAEKDIAIGKYEDMKERLRRREVWQ